MTRHRRPIKLCLVCTIGGHFEQMTNLSEFYNQYDHFWLTNKSKQTESQLAGEKKYFINQGHFTEPWTYLWQVPGILAALIKEKPTHFLSTGSGRTALLPFLLARLLGKPFTHIDTFSIVHGYSKFGNFLRKLRHPFLTQWEDLPNRDVTYIGPIFTNSVKAPDPAGRSHVFVTVGTRAESFARMIEAVDTLIEKGIIREKVIVQAGHTPYRSEWMEIFDFCTPDEIDRYISRAKYVITQESAGIGTKCLKLKTPFLVMPRDYQYGELPAASDMREDLHLKLQELGYTKVVHNGSELENAVKVLDEIKTGFVFDNSRAIRTLNRLVGENSKHQIRNSKQTSHFYSGEKP